MVSFNEKEVRGLSAAGASIVVQPGTTTTTPAPMNAALNTTADDFQNDLNALVSALRDSGSRGASSGSGGSGKGGKPPGT